MLKALPKLIEKLREFGEIKLAEVVYESKISDAQYKALIEVGFTQNIVAGNLDLHFLFQCYDLALSDNSIDMIVVGTERESLIPLFTEMRKEATTYALIESHMSKSFEECFDGVILVDKIDNFSFVTADLSEVSSLVSSINGNGDYHHDEISSDEMIMDANIGPMSESLVEQSDLIEVLKQKEIDNEDTKSETDTTEEIDKIKEPVIDTKESLEISSLDKSTEIKPVKKLIPKTRTTATKKVTKKTSKKKTKRSK